MGAANNGSILCVDGLMLPCWQPLDGVTFIDRAGRGLVYFLTLAYLFIGVSIISDRFMAAIEVITSQEKELSVRKPNGDTQIVVVRMWNETVANLTLMALGSSAPEILLSVIEIYAKNFEAGDLGPGTIVGSAAYNLLVIIAICVSVIPNGEVRKIKHLGVFFVTATWSVFAYIWLYLILCVFSPEIIEIWEGLLTFSFFPLTVLTAYAADRKIHKYMTKDYRMNRRGVIVQAEGENLELGNTELLALDDVNEDIKQEYITTLKDLRQQNPHADLGVLEKMAHEMLLNRGPKSRAFYRIQATRKLMGSGDLLRRISERAQSDLSEVKAELQRESGAAEYNQTACRVFFEPSKYTVLESCGRFEVRIVRVGNTDCPLTVEYTTEDGTAQAGSDYVKAKGSLQFGPGEKEKRIRLEVIDDDVFEPDEHFYIRLSSSQPTDSLGSPVLATVIILDDDHGGLFKFEAQNHELVESVGQYELKVVRCSGARGKVIIPYWTEDGTAKQGKEYEKQEGQLVFENNESEKSILLKIIEEDSYEKDVLFYVQLGEPQMTGDELANLAEEAAKKNPEDRTEREKIAILGKPRLGDITRAQIRIKESKEFKNTVDKLVQRANASLLIGTSSWKEQFMEALTVSSSDDALDDKDPSGLDYALHFLTIFWKILFAFVPPTDIFRGYLCFVVSIFCIGLVTAVIGDAASHFGATLGIKDAVTAIVFVALGTSIPDTFASKVAAIQDKHADASVGNVTGSNAVNVFLGIGVAWSIAAIYHHVNGNVFHVDPGNLAFSVTIFCTEAALVIIVLVLRRSKYIGGELGGPTYIKYFTSAVFFSLWIVYLIMSSLEVYGVIHGF
ncbi:sodium/calcium exchanger 3 isoform X2 [Diorhabda sublineata]|uniref:sodium/calcium exchanger 3 isoform X2 n=1 Tax=Diorhabda sublineata TaxID=1163346 RepID=UPI0024E07B7B|nr:sodium/calcium exchanger 3 isoform X2 [Diorhabda sublineata]